MRRDMTEEQEREFVTECYDNYEKEGFAEEFNSPYEFESKYNGKEFEVIDRVSLDSDDFDLECLPMWNIKFDDGEIITAFPEEIIKSEVKKRKAM